MPHGPRCGDHAEFDYEVEPELVGKKATLMVIREPDKQWRTMTTYVDMKVERKNTTVVWPDLEKDDGSYYGGRQFDSKGLDKLSYSEKFGKQRFKLAISCEKDFQNSDDDIEIKAYEDKGPDKKTVGMPGEIQKWENYHDIDKKSGKRKETGIYLLIKTYQEKYFEKQEKLKYNVGKFQIALKDGVVTITVKIRLTGTKAGDGPKIFKYIKGKVENFWNSRSSGYNQWVYHRRECERKSDCNCKVVSNSKGEYLRAGCCKFPFKVVLEEAAASDSVELVNVVGIKYLNLSHQIYAVFAKLNYRYGMSVGMHTQEFVYPENRPNSYAHEVGHMMGFPDQYPTGHVVSGAMGMTGSTGAGAFPIDKDSVMGTSQQAARLAHVGASWFDEWINDNVGEDVDVMDSVKK